KGFTPYCEYTAWSITVLGLAPKQLTYPQAKQQCQSLGMNLPQFAYLKDEVSWSVYDYDGRMTCRRFAQSDIGKKLTRYQSTGSWVAGMEKIAWLDRSSPHMFRGYGCPYSGDQGDIIAIFLNESGSSCHINPSCQPVDPNSKLDSVCTSGQMNSHLPITPAD